MWCTIDPEYQIQEMPQLANMTPNVSKFTDPVGHKLNFRTTEFLSTAHFDKTYEKTLRTSFSSAPWVDRCVSVSVFVSVSASVCV